MRRILPAVIIGFIIILTACEDKKAFSDSAVFAAVTDVIETNIPVLIPDTPAPIPTAEVYEEVNEEIEDDAEEGLPEGFVYTTDVVPDAILEIRYYSTYNFVGERIDGYLAPLSILTEEAANALSVASAILKDSGYVIKIFDTYRPEDAVAHFVRWGQDLDDTAMKDYFYPDLDKSALFNGFISSRSAHSRGSTVDLTLVDMLTGKEVDMGGPFDFFGSLSNFATPEITSEQAMNRAILKNAMEAAGFRAYSKEWWHFILNLEPFPDTYFNFPVQ